MDFYDRFMGNSADISGLFVNMDMKVQRHLLHNDSIQPVLHARGMSDIKLRALGKAMIAMDTISVPSGTDCGWMYCWPLCDNTTRSSSRALERPAIEPYSRGLILSTRLTMPVVRLNQRNLSLPPL
ncbi:hypothetical protein [Microbulbifer spongiae]|uniref:Uncharacterized protein n=1 Tax=Microbulbifer spongiae TaxID=2944933 RepID=A0ABY9EDG6_9GAMM|nr:hypothetical protein [Microbulbifer sp. MI-G]WKD49574.1 hypothetical protein M8T91_17030 [Microbulbifer sp. MI-G]